MIKQFAARSPRVRIALIYVAGYLAGTLLAILLGYLIRGAAKTSTTIVLGISGGTLAVALARHRGLAPTPEELNQPISLFDQK